MRPASFAFAFVFASSVRVGGVHVVYVFRQYPFRLHCYAHLGCFQSPAAVASTAMNTLALAFWWTRALISAGQILSSGAIGGTRVQFE